MIEDLEVRPSGGAARCPFCHGTLEASAERWTCPACGAAHHAECHGEAGRRCASCRAAPAPSARPPLRCARCHGPLSVIDGAPLTCERCAAPHHVGCAGERCARCLEPLRRPSAATLGPPDVDMAALGEGLLVNAAGLALAGLVGASSGGMNGLIVAGVACVVGGLVTVLRARTAEESQQLFVAYGAIVAVAFLALLGLVDALDVPRSRSSATMLVAFTLTAALMALLGRRLRRSDP